jgi:hypothetical protein
MHRKLLLMMLATTTSLGVATLGVATPGFTQSLDTFDEDAPEIRVESQPEAKDHVATEGTGGWVIEQNGEDAYPEMRGKSRAESSNRYVNPHPELGCLYYDENDKRHWFPGCREL